MHQPEGVPAEPVSVFDMAAHISRRVPAISQREFGSRQVPRFTPRGEDFPLGVRTAVLKDEPVISSVPTHVNTALLKVFKEAGGRGAVVQRLQPFTTVTLVKVEQGWALIARDRTILGYVPEMAVQKPN